MKEKSIFSKDGRGWNVFKRIIFFLAGALLLSFFSLIQKIFVVSIGSEMILRPRSYVVPVLYGGITGLLIGEWYLKLRREAARIQEKEEQLRTLIDSMPDFVIFKDGEGRWQEVNHSGEEVFGFDKASALDKTDLDLIESYPGLSSLLNRCRSSDEEAWIGRETAHNIADYFPSESGEIFFDIVKVPLYWPDGSRKGLVTIGRDITQVKRSKQLLEAAYDTTLAGWAKAVELRDRSTQDHTERVVQLSVKLARLVGFPEEDLVDLRRGAMLHDIGKISTPDSILTKPGPLSDEEFEIMQRHPVNAYQMLAHIAFLEKALDIPYCHHERWDGSGYPRGLSKENIPILARIFALADVWDALTNDRPYRQAWTDDKALTYISENTGSLFDPEITPIFLGMLENESV